MSLATILCTFLTIFALPVAALPVTAAIPQKNNETKVGWVAEPDGRGSFTILMLCTVTIGLCVWTALHLNVEPISLHRGNDDLEPPPNVIGKCLWAFIALVAPEMVSAVALHQHLVTRKYRKYVNASGQGGSEIGMMQAFFATMGGIAQVELIDRRIRPPRPRDREGRLVPMEYWDPMLTPLRFDKLLEGEWMGLIRKFSHVEVGIRSKQDALAKLIVFAQAAWVLVQCIARRIQDLPVSPLELHTALYIVNLMAMYAAWWQKPVDLGRPIFICTTTFEHSTQHVSIILNQEVRVLNREVDREDGFLIREVGDSRRSHRPSVDIVSLLPRIIESLQRAENFIHNPLQHMEGWQSLTATMEEVGQSTITMREMQQDLNIAYGLEIALRQMRLGVYSFTPDISFKLTPVSVSFKVGMAKQEA